MDVNRNVGVRDTCNDDNAPSATQPFANLFQYKSLPNMMFGEYELISPKIRHTDTTFYYRANSSEPNNNYIANCVAKEPEQIAVVKAEEEEQIELPQPPPPQPIVVEDVVDAAEECERATEEEEEAEHAVSGRLEIRLSREKIAKESSPNPEESVYFDAVVTANGPAMQNEAESKSDDKNVQYEEEFLWINKKEPQEKKYDIKVYEDSLKIQKYKIVTVDKSDDALDGADDDDDERGNATAPLHRHHDDVDNRYDNERFLRDCSNSKIPVFTNPQGSRMTQQRASWTGYWPEEPDISDLTPGELVQKSFKSDFLYH